jgi:hypothetical protein
VCIRGAVSADAVALIERGIERKDDLRKLAAEDSDFDPVRAEPGFRELVGT